MRLGEKLGVRWDFAFYQMILETGSLKYRNGRRAGDVKPTQNNFAGLGATGGGEPGESFKDIPTGVRAHLEHLLLYSGEKLENPVAERTRKVQEWGVLTKWQARFTKPITFSDLAQQWAPGSSSYARMLDGIAERFQEFCEKPDPRPEMAAAVRRELRLAEARPNGPRARSWPSAPSRPARPRTTQRRSALGAQESGHSAKAPPMPFKVLNAPPAEVDKLVADTPPAEPAPKVLDSSARQRPRRRQKRQPASRAKRQPPRRRPRRSRTFKTASAAGAAKPLVEPPDAAAGRSAACGPPAMAARRR